MFAVLFGGYIVKNINSLRILGFNIIKYTLLCLMIFSVCARFYFVYQDYKPPELPWWRSGWESTCQCRGHGFVPRSGKIPHATERLGPWAMAAEPACPEPVLRNGRGHNSERPAYRKKKKGKKRKYTDVCSLLWNASRRWIEMCICLHIHMHTYIYACISWGWFNITCVYDLTLNKK